jgi:hypothetical protein
LFEESSTYSADVKEGTQEDWYDSKVHEYYLEPVQPGCMVHYVITKEQMQ